MSNRKKAFSYEVKVLCVFSLVLCGCTTARFSEKYDKSKDKYALNQRPRITEDVLKFIDLKEIDLDNDGEKEIVAIYNAGLNLSGIKIIRVNSQADKTVVFTKVFNTHALRLEVRKGVLTLIVKDQDSAGCGLNKFYVWDGKDFCQTI